MKIKLTLPVIPEGINIAKGATIKAQRLNPYTRKGYAPKGQSVERDFWISLLKAELRSMGRFELTKPKEKRRLLIVMHRDRRGNAMDLDNRYSCCKRLIDAIRNPQIWLIRDDRPELCDLKVEEIKDGRMETEIIVESA